MKPFLYLFAFLMLFAIVINVYSHDSESAWLSTSNRPYLLGAAAAFCGFWASIVFLRVLVLRKRAKGK